MKQSHVMVDLETWATSPDAAIASIGACMFDPYAGPEQRIEEAYYQTISLDSNQLFDRQISAATVQWWFQQSDEARSALFVDQTNLPAAIQNLFQWLQHETTYRPTHIWANDPDFDVVILRAATDACRLYWPFGFWMNRSVRTVGDMAYPISEERKAVTGVFRTRGVHHNAKDDAIAQARFVSQCFHHLGVTQGHST